MNLTSVKNKLIQFRFLIIMTLVIIILGAVILIQQIQIGKPSPRQVPDVPPSIKEQPVINGHFDQNAQISQNSRKAIETLAPNLPHNETIKASTGNQISFSIFTNPLDPYTLRIEILDINFRSSYDDPNLPRSIQNFRETAQTIFSWIKGFNVSPGAIFISWGDRAYIQNNAEAWLTPSAKYPNVIKEGNNFVFETAPAK